MTHHLCFQESRHGCRCCCRSLRPPSVSRSARPGSTVNIWVISYARGRTSAKLHAYRMTGTPKHDCWKQVHLCTNEPWRVRHGVLGVTVFGWFGTDLLNHLMNGEEVDSWLHQNCTVLLELQQSWAINLLPHDLPSATALSAPCSAEPARWPLLPQVWSSVCALFFSAASPCRSRCSPADSHPAEASAPWSSYSTEGDGDNVILAVWGRLWCLYIELFAV